MASNKQSQEKSQDVVDGEVTELGSYLSKHLSNSFLATGANKLSESTASAVRHVGGLFNGESQSLVVVAAVNSLPTAIPENEWGSLPHCEEDILPNSDMFSTSNHPVHTLLPPCQAAFPYCQSLPSTEDRNIHAGRESSYLQILTKPQYLFMCLASRKYDL